MGVSCSDSARFCAVTTISSSGLASSAWVDAGLAPKASPIEARRRATPPGFGLLPEDCWSFNEVSPVFFDSGYAGFLVTTKTPSSRNSDLKPVPRSNRLIAFGRVYRPRSTRTLTLRASSNGRTQVMFAWRANSISATSSVPACTSNCSRSPASKATACPAKASTAASKAWSKTAAARNDRFILPVNEAHSGFLLRVMLGRRVGPQFPPSGSGKIHQVPCCGTSRVKMTRVPSAALR